MTPIHVQELDAKARFIEDCYAAIQYLESKYGSIITDSDYFRTTSNNKATTFQSVFCKHVPKARDAADIAFNNWARKMPQSDAAVAGMWGAVIETAKNDIRTAQGFSEHRKRIAANMKDSNDAKRFLKSRDVLDIVEMCGVEIESARKAFLEMADGNVGKLQHIKHAEVRYTR